MKRKAKRPKGAETPLLLKELYPSFPVLVWEMILCAEEQTIQWMADKTRIDHATLTKWINGRSKNPSLPHVIQWAQRIGLDVGQVLDLVKMDSVRYAMGIMVALPKITLKPGPRPANAPRRRGSITAIAGGSANDSPQGAEEPGTQSAENNRNLLPLIRRWLLRILWPPRPCPQLVRLDAAPIGS